MNLQRYPIHLCYEDGILTVDGGVEHSVAKELAPELAAVVPGVDGLVERLRVAPHDSGAIVPCATPCALRSSRKPPLRPSPSQWEAGAGGHYAACQWNAA